MNISVTSYSFMGYIRQGKMKQAEAVKYACDLGLSAVEFTDLFEENGKPCSLEEQKALACRIREDAEKYGMTVCAYAIGADLFRFGDDAEAEIARLCGQLDVAKLLGAPVMRHDVCWSLGKGEYRTFEAMVPVMARNIRRVTEYAQTLGIRTCSENHGFVAQDSRRVEHLIAAVGHGNYGALVDVGNFACADEDSVTAVSRMAPYAFHAHAKDFVKHPFAEHFKGGFETRGCNRLEGCAIGDGDIPVEQCIAILRRAGYDGCVSVEFEGSGDCIEGIKKGIERLKEYGV